MFLSSHLSFHRPSTFLTRSIYFFIHPLLLSSISSLFHLPSLSLSPLILYPLFVFISPKLVCLLLSIVILLWFLLTGTKTKSMKKVPQQFWVYGQISWISQLNYLLKSKSCENFQKIILLKWKWFENSRMEKKNRSLQRLFIQLDKCVSFYNVAFSVFLCLVRDKQVVLRFPLQSSSLLLGT